MNLFFSFLAGAIVGAFAVWQLKRSKVSSTVAQDKHNHGILDEQIEQKQKNLAKVMALAKQKNEIAQLFSSCFSCY